MMTMGCGLNSDLGDGGLEEEVGHGGGGEVGGRQSDRCHRWVAGTPLKVELNLETGLLKGSDGWNSCREIQYHTQITERLKDSKKTFMPTQDLDNILILLMS